MGADLNKHKQSKVVSQDDFKYLISNTKFSREEIHELSKKFEADYPSGTVNKDQFRDIYKSIFKEGDSGPLVDYVFASYDEDHNGTISFREFLTAINVTTAGSDEEKLNWTFKLYDVNEDKSISLEELTNLLSAIYKAQNADSPRKAAEAKAKRLLADMDFDKSGTASRSEFVRHALSKPEIRKLLSGEGV